MELSFLTAVGWVGAILVGVLLGLLGGGGSILTVPLLVYLFGLSATVGTGASLLVVGSSALLASIAAFRSGEFEFNAAWPFALGSVPAVFAVRQWVIPSIPESLMVIGQWELTRDRLLLIMFGVLMLVIGARMLRKGEKVTEQNEKPKVGFLIGIGVATGVLAGLVGAGGGFIIVPALVLGAGLGMKKAVGTSLGIISIQSLAGFLGAMKSFNTSVLGLVGIVCFLALVGVFIGRWLSGKMEATQIRPIFAWFVVSMGVFILLRETFF